MEYDITNVVVGVLIGMGLALGIIALYIWHVMNRFEQELRQHVKQAVREVEAQMMGVVVEEDAGQLYFYREADRQFLCQGTTLAEVRKRFNDMYPEKIAYLAGGDPALIERLKNELKVIKEQEKDENSISV